MTVAPLRVARGTAVATVAVLLAVAGHATASGARPEVTPLAVLGTLLVALGCVVASARSWTPARLLVALLGVQVVSHVALTGPSGPVDPRLAGLMPAAGHAHGHGPVPPGMLAAHLLAAALAAVLLARVDTAVTTLWHLARHALGGVRPTGLALPCLVRPAVPGTALLPVERRLATVPARRGPPARRRP